MSSSRPPLESPEAFAAYCERVKLQLKSHIVERISFLENAQGELLGLEALARRANNPALVGELATLSEQAQRELMLLRRSSAPALCEPHANGNGNGNTLALNGATEPHRAIETPPTLYAAITALPTESGAANGRGAIQKAAPVVPPVPKTPHRPLEEVYHDADALGELAERQDDSFEGTPGLIRLKGLLCRQRALQAELAAQDIQHWPLRQLLNYLRKRIDEQHGAGHYLIPLRAELWPMEAWPWNQLTDLYDGLAQAYEALEWYDAEAEKLNQPERHELLESIGAHQTSLWRHLQTYFPRQNDEHQINLFRELCSIAEEEDIYLFSLQERCPDETLAERAEQLPIILEQLKLDRRNRARREATLQRLRALVTHPDFGTRDSDPQALAEAVAACRAEGLAASSTALRALLADWLSLLEESTDKTVQEVAREIAKDAERRERKLHAENCECERPLLDCETAELETVKALVRGKRCLFIGGICREESRQRLERELELAELIWPSTNGTESVYRFEADIQHTDITVILVRFMRTGWGQARELAVRHGKLFVRLPAGYGLMQVVRQFKRQICHEEQAAAAAR